MARLIGVLADFAHFAVLLLIGFLLGVGVLVRCTLAAIRDDRRTPWM